MSEMIKPLERAEPERSKKEKHTYETEAEAECRDGPGRLQNCCEIARGGPRMKQEREANLQNCSGMPGRAGTAIKMQ